MGPRAIGIAALVGGAGVAVWMLSSEGNPFAEVVDAVSTRYSGGDGELGAQDATSEPRASRAQQIQMLEKDVSRLESEIEGERNRIESEFDRRMASATFDGIGARVRRECQGAGWCPFDPWCGCDDRVLAEVKAEHRQWREDQINDWVRPLEQELGEVEAELESLLITA